ncbi:MAG: hypothetical protein ACHRXM_04320 [Isosphaerales bacterium]
MRSETALLVSYSCPHCRVQLETRSDGWDGWLRCPVCERVSLPPEPVGFLDAGQQPVVSSKDNATPVTTGLPDASMIPDGPRQASTLRASHTSPARLIFTTGFVLSLVLGLLAFLDLRPTYTAIFGFLSITFFLLLLRTPRKRVAPWGLWRSPSVGKDEG